MANLTGLTATHPTPPSGNPSGTPSGTVAQIFQSKKLVQWWTTPTQRFGQNGEQGCDFGIGLNTPIGSITSGKVVYTGYTNDASLGYVVQILMSDGSLIHYQHMNSLTVRTGSTVSVGQVLGLSGGPPGQYSTGPHIEVRYSSTFNAALANGTGVSGAFWSDGHWVDPLGTILNIAGGPPGGPVSNGTNGSGGLPGFISGLFSGLLGFTQTSNAGLPTGASFNLPQVHITPTGDVTNFLVALDANLEIVNPFNVTNAAQDSILGATFTDPISWIEGFGYNVWADLGAFLWRVVFIVFGAYLCFKVANHFINFSGLLQSGTQIAGSLAMLAA